MKKVQTQMLAVIMALGILQAPVWAETPAPERPRRGAPDEEQLARRETMRQLRADHHRAQDYVWTLMQDENTTEEDLVNATRRAARLMTRMEVERAKHFIAMRERVGHEQAIRMAERMRARRQEAWRGSAPEDAPRRRERVAPDPERRPRPDRAGPRTEERRRSVQE